MSRQVIDFKKMYLKECRSTNDVLKSIENPLDHWCVYTFHQTHGRGQQAKQWMSEKGKNLAISLSFPIQSVGLSRVHFTMAIANIVRHYLATMLGENVYIKWPNDLLISEKKISGILVEKNAQSYVVGIGINVNQEKFEDLPHATSLINVSRRETDLEDFAMGLIDLMGGLYDISTKEIESLYHHYLYRKNQEVQLRFQGKTHAMIIKKVDSQGMLHAENGMNGTLYRFRNGEIQWEL